MFAGHFSFVPVLQKYYPTVSPFVFTFGVIFLDVIFAGLGFFGIEGFAPVASGGHMGVEIHCDYSHSVIGSILLSLIYGGLTQSMVPGFLASMSHFVADWLVHNQDLLLDPYTKIAVGGTNLWGNHPTFAFYFELVFLIGCHVLFGSFNTSNVVATLFLSAVHIHSKSTNPKMFAQVMSLPQPTRQQHAALITLGSFGALAIILGFIYSLQRRNKISKKE